MACCRNTSTDSGPDRDTDTGVVPYCSADTGSYRRTCAYSRADADTNSYADHNADTTAGVNAADACSYSYSCTDTYANSDTRRHFLLRQGSGVLECWGLGDGHR